MFYTYNRQNLIFKRFGFKHYSIAALVLFLTYTAGRYTKVNHLTSYEKDLIIYLDHKYFSEENLIKVLKAKNINKPHIVLAQATLETGNFTSDVFKENHNLFGMKLARSRPTTRLGIKHGHAYYENWESSVEDYGYYQAYQGLAKIKNDEQYYNLLYKLGYAEDPNYILKVKKLAEELKDKF